MIQVGYKLGKLRKMVFSRLNMFGFFSEKVWVFKAMERKSDFLECRDLTVTLQTCQTLKLLERQDLISDFQGVEVINTTVFIS